MYLDNIFLHHFKSYIQHQFNFHPRVNCLLGPNGTGKTNVLDAIHYISFTKSMHTSYSKHHIKHSCLEFVLRGSFVTLNGSVEVMCKQPITGRKIIMVQHEECSKLSNYIGQHPSIAVAPNDIDLIWGTSKIRRFFFDGLIAQIDRKYCDSLIIYAHQLKQRNALLKSSMGMSIDYKLLEVYNEKMIANGHYIYQKRQSFLQDFLPIFSQYYHVINDEAGEMAGITYQSDYEEKDIEKQLSLTLPKDRILGRTSIGIHRDEYTFMLGDYEAKQVGSQGQQKTFLIALKLAAFHSIKKARNVKPLLLLDDVFDKLDDKRIDHLINYIASDTFGQIFITDARPSRTLGLLEEKIIDKKIFNTPI